MVTARKKSQSERIELESKVLVAAFKQSVDLGDSQGAQFAHKQLFGLLQTRHRSHSTLLRSAPALTGIQPAGNAAATEQLVAHVSETQKPEPPNLQEFAAIIQAAVAESVNDMPQSEVASANQKPLEHQHTAAAQARAEFTKLAPENGAPIVEGLKSDLANLFPSLEHQGSQPEDESPYLFRKLNRIAESQQAAPPAPRQTPRSRFVPHMSDASANAIDAEGKAAVPSFALSEKKKQEVEQLMGEIANAGDLYALLGTDIDAPDEVVHANFIKRALKLLSFKVNGSYSRTVLHNLRSLWIARDILLDLKSRSEYTESLAAKDRVSPASRPTQPQQRARPKVGELLAASGLLEPTELQIACDMHRAMPEMHFGRFLVNQGFLEEAQLRAVLAAQKLISGDKLTVDQFRQAMNAFIASGSNFSDVLIAKGYCSEADLAEIEGLLKLSGRSETFEASLKRNIASNSLSGRLQDAAEDLDDGKEEFSIKLQVKTQTKITNSKLRKLIEEHENVAFLLSGMKDQDPENSSLGGDAGLESDDYGLE